MTLPKTLNLQTRGKTTYRYIDFFTEVENGAGNLFLALGNTDIDKIKEAVTKILLDYNPTATDNSNPLCLNRYREQRKYEKYNDIGVFTPTKSKYALEFLVRIKTYEDFIYLNFGKRWTKDPVELELWKQESFRFELNDLEVLDHCMVDSTDSKIILESIIK